MVVSAIMLCVFTVYLSNVFFLPFLFSARSSKLFYFHMQSKSQLCAKRIELGLVYNHHSLVFIIIFLHNKEFVYWFVLIYVFGVSDSQ